MVKICLLNRILNSLKRVRFSILDYKFEASKYNDWLGILLFVVNLELIGVIVFVTPVLILMELDPFYHVFEIVLASPYERNMTTILSILLLRFFLVTISILELARFCAAFLIAVIVLAFTFTKCLQQLVHTPQINERVLLNYYIHLRIVLKIADFFLRHFVALLLIFAQVLITVSVWMVLKCRHVLPIAIIFVAYFTIVVATIALLVLLPCAVKITESSQKFVMHKLSLHHTFNRHHRDYYYFVKWRSQRLLPIRCGEQFILSQDSELNYYQILMTNLTNAILLIKP